MAPLGHMRLLFLPVALIGLYLMPRLLLPGALGVVVGVVLVGVTLLWAVLRIRRNRGV